MALTKEQLISAGIEEEIAEKIVSNVNKLFKEQLDNNYVSKESFNDVNTKKNELQTQLNNANTEIKKLKPFEEQVSILNNKLMKANTDLSALQTKYDNQAIVLQNENAVKNIVASVAIDPDDVLPKIDMSKIVFIDGKIESGLNEQIEALKTAKPHYFKQDNNNSGHFFGISPNNSSNNNTLDNNVSKAVEFAKSIAQDAVAQKQVLQKANDVYFKGGTN